MLCMTLTVGGGCGCRLPTVCHQQARQPEETGLRAHHQTGPRDSKVMAGPLPTQTKETTPRLTHHTTTCRCACLPCLCLGRCDHYVRFVCVCACVRVWDECQQRHALTALQTATNNAILWSHTIIIHRKIHPGGSY
jgi:hypothetical protein